MTSIKFFTFWATIINCLLTVPNAIILCVFCICVLRKAVIDKLSPPIVNFTIVSLLILAILNFVNGI